MRQRSAPRPLVLAAAAAVSALSIASDAHGSFVSGMIDMHFVGTNGTAESVSGAAVVGSSGDFWNSSNLGVESSSYSLLNTQSQSTGVSATWISTGTWNSGITNSTPNPNLMNGYTTAKYTSTTGYSNATVTISGLSADTEYTVYVYSQSWSASRSGTFTVSSDLTSTYQTITSDTFASWVAGGNYLSFTTESGDNGELVITDAVAGTGSENDFNGFQIIPAPEPASAAVLVGGAMLALSRRRPRRST